MGSTAHATKYHSLSRCFVNTNLPTTNAYSAYSSYSKTAEVEQVEDDEMRSEFSTYYSIPWKYKSTNYKPRKNNFRENSVGKSSSYAADSYAAKSSSYGADSYATNSSNYASKSALSDLSYSNYVRKNLALSSRYTSDYQSSLDQTKSVQNIDSHIKIPVSVRVTVTEHKPRTGKSEYQLYQEELKSYKPPQRKNFYSSNTDYQTSRLNLISSDLKEKELSNNIDIGIKKIKIVDNETYNRLLTPIWKKYKVNKYEIDSSEVPEVDVSDYLENYNSSKLDNDLESTTNVKSSGGYRLSRSISTSALSKSSVKQMKSSNVRHERSVTPEPREVRETTPVRVTEVSRPLYLGRTGRDTSVYWPGRNCTAKELTNIITEPSHGNYVLPFDAFNEVYPGLFLGDMSTALCTKQLRELGVTHVLNAAQKDSRPGQLPGYYVNTSPHYYSRVDIDYLGVPATDVISFDLSPYFEEAADFVDNALATGGKVLVHCHQGISRSATLVLAFLMLKRGMSAQEAMRTVRAKREIIPNSSFLRQLCELNNRLMSGRRRFQDMHKHY